MADIFEMQMIRQANDLIQRAANSVASARTHLPALPPINPDVLQAARMGVFQNFLIGKPELVLLTAEIMRFPESDGLSNFSHCACRGADVGYD